MCTASGEYIQVAVDERVDVGVNGAKHRLQHVPLALPGLGQHPRPGITRVLGAAIGRVVVADVDRRGRKRRAKVCDHLGDGRFFVEAGNEHRQLRGRPGVSAHRDGEAGCGTPANDTPLA